jgi:hypothetical protein
MQGKYLILFAEITILIFSVSKQSSLHPLNSLIVVHVDILFLIASAKRVDLLEKGKGFLIAQHNPLPPERPREKRSLSFLVLRTATATLTTTLNFSPITILLKGQRADGNVKKCKYVRRQRLAKFFKTNEER